METLASVETAVDRILERVGRDLRVATPLGIGKPNHLLNALYRRAKADAGLSLEIYTALTLQVPEAKSDLEKRFLDPLKPRLFGNYPDLDYERDRMASALPRNVRVYEFFFQSGKYLALPEVQRAYISTNYTYVARDLHERGVNVLMAQVALEGDACAPRLSLSSNPDVTLDLLDLVSGRDDVIRVVQSNGQLPFMPGAPELEPDAVDVLVHAPEQDYTLFGPPKESLDDIDMLIGLHVSTLIRDGGELQIGIGSLGDALVHALCLRHLDNARYRALLDDVGFQSRAAANSRRLGGLGPFEEGLFAATEMLVDAYQFLYEAGIIKREVFDDIAIQRVLNRGELDAQVSPAWLTALRTEHAIGPILSERDVDYLKRFGILHPDVTWEDGRVRLPDGSEVRPELADEVAFAQLSEKGLGTRLQGGCVIHAGFFVGPQAFYQWLRDLPEAERAKISMRSITRVNDLYGSEDLDRLHRVHGRFVNTAMMVTLGGAVVSDGLEDGRVVSGVGGQYNFVSMAHALPDGHSIIQLRATRMHRGELRSNIVPSYGHTTIARHQRDLVVTEYGVANLRGMTDEEIIVALLKIADSRFQPALMEAAKQSGKLAPDYALPAAFTRNLPETFTSTLARHRARGLLPRYPFGSDFTEVEQVLAEALQSLKRATATRKGMARLLAEAMLHGPPPDAHAPYLARLGLDDPITPQDLLYRTLVSEMVRRVLAD